LEVQGLREDIQRFAGTSIRVQLLLARLQLEEQRINTLGGQIADVRRLMDTNATAHAELSSKVKRYTDGNNAAADFPAEMQQQIRDSVPGWKAELQRLQTEGQRLSSQEADLVGQAFAEQGRWTDFNARLDELERSLPAIRR
jgi:hypothetical protein